MDNDKPVFIVNGERVDGSGKPVDAKGNRVSTDTPTPDTQGSAAELEKERAAHAQTRQELESLHGELEAAKLDLGKMTEERDDWRTQYSAAVDDSAGALKKASEAWEAWEADKAEWEKQRVSLMADTAAALDREKASQARISELELARPIPGDALDRLIGVKGINEALAQKALDALTADAAPAQPEK